MNRLPNRLSFTLRNGTGEDARELKSVLKHRSQCDQKLSGNLIQQIRKKAETMGEQTKIQWCDHTFNPWVGCTKVSPGCAHCYAEADMDQRRHFAKWGPNGTRVMTSAANWKKPLKWDRDAAAAGVRRVVFCASLADVFEDWAGPIVNSKGNILWTCETCGNVSESSPYHSCANKTCRSSPDREATLSDLRSLLFSSVIAQTPNLIWRILTKRPENIRRFWPLRMGGGTLQRADNVFLYTSVENQTQADRRIPQLLDCTDLSPVLGISAEPLLEQIELEWLAPGMINHVIVGGESGPGARPFCSEWARSLFEQCRFAGVPFFMKQFGSNGYMETSKRRIELNLKDPKGGDPSEWPEMFDVRELPEEFYSL